MDAISELTASCLSHSNSSFSFLSEENWTITEHLSINHVTVVTPKEVQHIMETLPSSAVAGTDHSSTNMLKKSPYVL